MYNILLYTFHIYNLRVATVNGSGTTYYGYYYYY